MFDIFVYYLRRYVNSCILTVNLNIGHYIVRSRLGGLLGGGGGGDSRAANKNLFEM